MKYIKSCLGQNLRDYLYKNYYADHQQMYSVKGAKRPIYWLFSSQMGDKKKKGYGTYGRKNVDEFWAEVVTKGIHGNADKYTRKAIRIARKYKL